MGKSYRPKWYIQLFQIAATIALVGAVVSSLYRKWNSNTPLILGILFLFLALANTIFWINHSVRFETSEVIVWNGFRKYNIPYQSIGNLQFLHMVNGKFPYRTVLNTLVIHSQTQEHRRITAYVPGMYFGKKIVCEIVDELLRRNSALEIYRGNFDIL